MVGFTNGASYLKNAERLFPFIDRAGWEFCETAAEEQFETPTYRLSNDVLTAFGMTMRANLVADRQTNLRVRMTNEVAEAILSGEMKPLYGLDGEAVSTGRVFAVSLIGVFCLAQKQAMPGDIIVFVSGGEVPLLLRPQQDNFSSLANATLIA